MIEIALSQDSFPDKYSFHTARQTFSAPGIPGWPGARMARAAYRQKSMNKTYRTVWNAARGAIVAVSELDRANGKGKAGAGARAVARGTGTSAALKSV
ncbi:ESPR domain-containing protein, partial [Bacillus licheniformis]|nr:ESPR domain-containing protein [Bacillus licheniformis]